MHLFSVTIKFYYFTNQINVSVTISSHHHADPKCIKEEIIRLQYYRSEISDLAKCTMYMIF